MSRRPLKHIDATNYKWQSGEGAPIGELLTDDLFFYREDFHEIDESILLELTLIESMPKIVTSRNPSLRAAKINIQLADGTPEEYIHSMEQEALFAKLMEQSVDNPDQVNLKEEISRMLEAPRFDIRSPK